MQTLFPLLCFFLLATTPIKSKVDGVRTLLIDDKKLIVEIADSPETRERGLMYRKELPRNQGMLFVFDDPQRVGFWMKDTFIPLDIAFVNEQGVISEIRSMRPQDLTSIQSKSDRILYSIEVNQGWFYQNNITPGMRVKGLP
jgi:uncharacterized protein